MENGASPSLFPLISLYSFLFTSRLFLPRWLFLPRRIRFHFLTIKTSLLTQTLQWVIIWMGFKSSSWTWLPRIFWQALLEKQIPGSHPRPTESGSKTVYISKVCQLIVTHSLTLECSLQHLLPSSRGLILHSFQVSASKSSPRYHTTESNTSTPFPASLHRIYHHFINHICLTFISMMTGTLSCLPLYPLTSRSTWYRTAPDK